MKRSDTGTALDTAQLCQRNAAWQHFPTEMNITGSTGKNSFFCNKFSFWLDGSLTGYLTHFLKITNIVGLSDNSAHIASGGSTIWFLFVYFLFFPLKSYCSMPLCVWFIQPSQLLQRHVTKSLKPEFLSAFHFKPEALVLGLALANCTHSVSEEPDR